MSHSQRQEEKRRVALVTTTIHVPRFLTDVLANAETNGHLDRLSVIVIGDRKTPPAVGDFLADLGRRHPAVQFLDVAAQSRLLRRWPALDLFLRYDSIQRRNVGYLQAARDGADLIITMDDDNYVTDDDLIGHHAIVGTTAEVPVVSHPSGWWNVCERLTAEPARRFYHRGFPKSQQTWTTGGHHIETSGVRVVANAGLWLGAPDVDATTHIEEPIDVAAMQPIDGSDVCALASGTWCPLNSQNTAFDIAALPALYLPVMHDWVRGYRIARMDDIWMSYALRAIADARGEAVSYGPPLVRQERNPHNFLADLATELAGYLLTERLIEYLRQFKSAAGSWLDAYLDLIYHLRECVESDQELERPDREYLRQLTLGMAAWHAAAADILGNRASA